MQQAYWPNKHVRLTSQQQSNCQYALPALDGGPAKTLLQCSWECSLTRKAQAVQEGSSSSAAY
jgi:hypothetical protein